MTQLTLSATGASIVKDECAICGKKHDEPKKPNINPVAPSDSGWKRKSMKKVFESIPKKNKIYPNNFPPPYDHQGHHCLALSYFVSNAETNPKDINMTLNHYLKKADFFPNRDSNCIGLPAMPSDISYDAFWEALNNKKPLQMHGSTHDETYFTEVRLLMIRVMSKFSTKNFCKNKNEDALIDVLKKRIAHAENFSFKSLAAANMPWRLHNKELRFATKLYFMPLSDTKLLVKEKTSYTTEITGYGQGNKTWDVKYPSVSLDVGKFG